MCLPGTHIKLCTCEPEDIDENFYWQLLKSNDEHVLQFVGSFVLSEPSVTEALLSEKIADDLNTRNCFDFLYAAAEGDLLRIHLADKMLCFIYTRGGWEASSGHGITGGPTNSGTVRTSNALPSLSNK